MSPFVSISTALSDDFGTEAVRKLNFKGTRKVIESIFMKIHSFMHKYVWNPLGAAMAHCRGERGGGH